MTSTCKHKMRSVITEVIHYYQKKQRNPHFNPCDPSYVRNNIGEF